MLEYEIQDRVAIARPTVIPAPSEWIASLDAVLDDAGAWCLLIDARGVRSIDSAWNEEASRDARLWRKPIVGVIAGAIEGHTLSWIQSFDITVAHGDATFGGTPAVAARQRGDIFAISPDPYAEGLRVATVIASRAPHATQLAKEAIWRGSKMPLAQALRFETDLTLLLQTTKDRAEGVAAFLEKRHPHFIGS